MRARLVDVRLLLGVAWLSAGFYLILWRHMHEVTKDTSTLVCSKDMKFERCKIVLLGDSLTQLSFQAMGWGASLADRYQRRCDVLNRGYSGYNSRWIMELVSRKLIEAGPEVMLMTVFLGANDASLVEHNPRQHVPLEEYRANLVKISEYRGPRPLVFVSPPPVCHGQRLDYQKKRYGAQATGALERTNENAGIYAQACVEVAAQLGRPCLDLWTLMQTREDWPKFLNDGLHFSQEGNSFVAKHLVDVIEAAFPDFTVTPDPHTGNFGTSGAMSTLRPHAPWHDKIDHRQPSQSFDEVFCNDNT